MTILSLSTDTSIRTALAYASGTADRNGIAIDTAGYDSVLFIVHFATIAAGTHTVKVQQDIASAMGAAADLAGTAVTVAADDDDQIKYIDLHNVRERYLRVVIDKDGTNATAELAVAILYNGRTKRPITQVAGETEGERHVFPAEGTA